MAIQKPIVSLPGCGSGHLGDIREKLRVSLYCPIFKRENFWKSTKLFSTMNVLEVQQWEDEHACPWSLRIPRRSTGRAGAIETRMSNISFKKKWASRTAKQLLKFLSVYKLQRASIFTNTSNISMRFSNAISVFNFKHNFTVAPHTTGTKYKKGSFMQC